MSVNGLDVFDRTLHTTNAWLKELSEELDVDRHGAWKVLSVVLHKLRDRLPVDLSAHLGSQLPLLIRGVYYDQYQPAKQPNRCSSLDEFVADVGDWLTDAHSVDPRRAIEAVCHVLSRHLAPGQIDKVRANLPKGLRPLWSAPADTPPRRRPEKIGQAAAAMATGI
ncbi:uncharacterized protein (DUF2267 family) [Phenylobacterium haematophilum]|jgi:uncharacterized protein (DUF2267 family)|uniref:Uncharacterized protein (DUF2267 family) n=1 Tax=Phenylobacterium haematophilum TaxID=98513 RepID=A0A839ZZY2_9CAUL|nr:DUF2267 domain-containing protein [Phenylobacterium haematophilum]MBB3890677.1 uncharacterized protein (DUF2267 family) [Phenylobacterium haematophilum]